MLTFALKCKYQCFIIVLFFSSFSSLYYDFFLQNKKNFSSKIQSRKILAKISNAEAWSFLCRKTS